MSFASTSMQNSFPTHFENYNSQQQVSSGDVGSCKIKRLMAESVEVALSLCHRYLGSVGNVKLFDIVNQIIPTGWVLNTGYWVYYSNQQGHSLCVCSRFAIACRHVRNTDHWLDLSSTTDHLPDATAINLPKSASLTVTNFECNVAAMGYELYNISVRFYLHVRSDPGRPLERKQMWFDGNYTISVERYITTEVFIMFHPNPQSMPSYGRIFTEILINSGVEETFVTSNTSKHTFILSLLNTQYSYTTLAFPMLQASHSNRNKMVDAFTQTDNATVVTLSAPFYQYSQPSTPLDVSQQSLQSPSTSTSFYNQLPPPYSLPKPVKKESLQYKERFDNRGRRGGRGSGSNTEGYGNVTLSMFLNNETFNQPQPQTSRGRRQKSNVRPGRRVKAEIKEQSEEMNVDGVPDDMSRRINSQLSFIDEIISEDFLNK